MRPRFNKHTTRYGFPKSETTGGIHGKFWASAPPGTLQVSQGSSPSGQPMTQGTFTGFIPSLDAYNALALQAYKERTGEDFPGYDPGKVIYSTGASFDRGMPIDLNKSAAFFKSFRDISDEEAANQALKLATRELYIRNRPFAEQERQRRIEEGKARADAWRAGRWKSSLVG